MNLATSVLEHVLEQLMNRLKHNEITNRTHFWRHSSEEQQADMDSLIETNETAVSPSQVIHCELCMNCFHVSELLKGFNLSLQKVTGKKYGK